jgi:hypothetical protein
MSLGKNTHRLGGLTKDDIDFPEHLTPEIIHCALFVHNAPTKEEIKVRVDYCAKQIGDKAMSYAMALLVLPVLMDNMAQSNEYKEWQQQRTKTLH